jgi:hypothetical protein
MHNWRRYYRDGKSIDRIWCVCRNITRPDEKGRVVHTARISQGRVVWPKSEEDFPPYNESNYDFSLRVGTMEIPEKITIVDGYYFTDGGSIVLLVEEPDKTRHQITLGQHLFLEMFDPNLLPGRLYWDHLLVPVRSAMEAEVIDLLRSGEIIPDEPLERESGEGSTGDGPVVVVGDDLKEYYAKVADGKNEVIRHLIEKVVGFVGSREYVRIARKIEKKTGRI